MTPEDKSKDEVDEPASGSLLVSTGLAACTKRPVASVEPSVVAVVGMSPAGCTRDDVDGVLEPLEPPVAAVDSKNVRLVT